MFATVTCCVLLGAELEPDPTPQAQTRLHQLRQELMQQLARVDAQSKRITARLFKVADMPDTPERKAELDAIDAESDRWKAELARLGAMSERLKQTVPLRLRPRPQANAR